VGSTPAVMRIYKMTLWLNVWLQFATFFTMTVTVIWFDKIKTNIMPVLANNKLYDAAFYVTIVLLLPWFLLGSISVRREHRIMFWGFISISVILLAIRGAWFASALYRYEFLQWSFFAAITVASDVFLLITCGFAVVCRVHFGRGLAHYLWVQQMLQDTGFTQATFVHNPNNVATGDNVKSLSVIFPKRLEIKPTSRPISRPLSSASLYSEESADLEKLKSFEEEFSRMRAPASNGLSNLVENRYSFLSLSSSVDIIVEEVRTADPAYQPRRQSRPRSSLFALFPRAP